MGITNVGEVVLAPEVLGVGGSGLAALMACNDLALAHVSAWPRAATS